MSDECQYIIRPAREDDIRFLHDLSKRTGPGFTSLQPDIDFLNTLISKSEAAFAHPARDTSQTFLLVMESFQNREVVGCASIKNNIGTDDFMCADFELDCHDVGATATRHGDDRLILKRTLQGHTEVGSLFLHPEHRASGAGRLLARARYLLMGTTHHLFERPIVSQLRGWCDPNGHSPFYDEVWKTRLTASYEQCDARLAREGAGHILKTFAGLDLSLNDLSAEALNAIGRPHASAAGALRLLEQEGFVRSSLVDLSDAGPILLAKREALRSLQATRQVEMRMGAPASSASLGMICNNSFKHFQALVGRFDHLDDEIICPAWMHEAFDTMKTSCRVTRSPDPNSVRSNSE